MPCTNCMAAYSKFNKEHGCSRCTFGFCNKCIKNKFIISNLSPQPVSVCDNCYNILTGQVIQFDNKSRGLATKSVPSTSVKSNNWWGHDKLPPPSMRMQYEKERKIALKQKNNASYYDKFENCFTDFAKEDKKKMKHKITDNLFKEKLQKSMIPSLSEIEERLSLLRGVSVDLIQKPRLMIIDSDEIDFSSDDNFTDEARELLKAVEAKSKINVLHHGYDNPALQLDDNLNSGYNKQSNCSSNLNSEILSTKTSNSLVQRIIQNTQDDLLIKSNSLSDLSSICIYPNCINETIRDAEKAECDAMICIQQFQVQNQKTPVEQTYENNKIPVNKSQKIIQKKLIKEKEMNSPKKKAITFFHRFFK